MKKGITDSETYLKSIGWEKPFVVNPEKITLGMLYEYWVKDYSPILSKKTMGTYCGIWKRSFNNISDMLFINLRIDHIQAMLNYHVEENMSKSWLDKFRQLGNYLYSFAIKKNIVKQNLMCYVKVYATIPETKNKREIFTSSEIKTLFEYAENKNNFYWRDARLTLILIFTGFRPSELFSIRLNDVHIQDGYIIGGAKTKTGKFRMVPILSIIGKYILEEYRISEANKVNNSKLLLTTSNGSKISLDNWRARKFYPLLRELSINSVVGKARINPYSARHTFASLAYSADVDKLVLQRVIGHVDFEMLSKVYIHTNIEQYRNEFEKVNKLFENLGG